MITAGVSRVTGLRAARSLASVVRSSAEKRVVEQIDLRLAHQRAGNGESLPLPAGDRRAALCDGCLQSLGHVPHEIGGLRDLSASQSSSSVASDLP